MLLRSFVILLIALGTIFGDNSTMLPSTKKEVKFDQFILAVGVPYYKLLMVLGDCNKTLLFEEQKAWGKVRYNRVLDIYYKSQNPDFLVSKVEIIVVLDNTDCSVYSRNGIGQSEFAATMFIPTRVSMIFYHLFIWTCSQPTNEDSRQYEVAVDSREKIEEMNINKMPLYERPLRPDVGPHHIYYNSSPVVFVHPNEYDENVSKLKAKSSSKTTTKLPLSFIFITPESAET